MAQAVLFKHYLFIDCTNKESEYSWQWDCFLWSTHPAGWGGGSLLLFNSSIISCLGEGCDPWPGVSAVHSHRVLLFTVCCVMLKRLLWVVNNVTWRREFICRILASIMWILYSKDNSKMSPIKLINCYVFIVSVIANSPYLSVYHE